MVNPAMIFKIKGLWDEFARNHPKFPGFLLAASGQPMEEGTVIELSILRPNGDSLTTNVKLKASDLELFEQLKELGTGSMQ